MHKASIAVAVGGSSGDPEDHGQIPNDPAAIRKLVGRLGRTPGCDAAKLARLLHSGDLTPVWIPDEAGEALRDLVRARDDAKADQLRARHRLSKFLLRRAVHPPAGVRAWSRVHEAWLERVTFAEVADRVVVDDYRSVARAATERVKRLEATARQPCDRLAAHAILAYRSTTDSDAPAVSAAAPQIEDGGEVMRTLIVLVVLAFMSAACSGAAAPSSSAQQTATASSGAAASATAQASVASEPVTLTIMHNWPESDAKGPAMQAFIAACKATNPNLTIQEEVFTDTDIPTKVETSYIAGQEPDLVFQNFGSQTATWADKGITVPVNSYLEDWGLKDVLRPNALHDYTVDGKVLAFPMEGFTWPIWYNQTILDAAEVAIPKTVDELVAAAPKIRAAGFQPFVVGGGDWPGQGFLAMMSLGYMTDLEGEQLWSDGGFVGNPKVQAWIDDFVRMRDAGVFADGSEGYNYDQMNQLYFDGKAAMLMGGSWSFGDAPAEIQQATVLGGLPIGQPSSRTKPISEGGFQGKGVWITRNGATKLDAVRDCIKTLYEPAVQAAFVEQAAMLSAVADLPVDNTKLNPLFTQSFGLADETDLVELMDAYYKPGVDPTVFKTPFLKGTSASEIIEGFEDAYK